MIAKAVGHAVKRIKRDYIVDDCEELLRSLSTRYGLKLVGTKLDRWNTVAEFANDTSGVIFHYERRDDLVQAELAELKADKIVPMPVIIRDDSPLSTLPLCDVLVALSASDEPCKFGSSKSAIRTGLIGWLEHLKHMRRASLKETFRRSMPLANG